MADEDQVNILIEEIRTLTQSINTSPEKKQETPQHEQFTKAVEDQTNQLKKMIDSLESKSMHYDRRLPDLKKEREKDFDIGKILQQRLEGIMSSWNAWSPPDEKMEKIWEKHKYKIPFAGDQFEAEDRESEQWWQDLHNKWQPNPLYPRHRTDKAHFRAESQFENLGEQAPLRQRIVDPQNQVARPLNPNDMSDEEIFKESIKKLGPNYKPLWDTLSETDKQEMRQEIIDMVRNISGGSKDNLPKSDANILFPPPPDNWDEHIKKKEEQFREKYKKMEGDEDKRWDLWKEENPGWEDFDKNQPPREPLHQHRGIPRGRNRSLYADSELESLKPITRDINTESLTTPYDNSEVVTAISELTKITTLLQQQQAQGHAMLAEVMVATQGAGGGSIVNAPSTSVVNVDNSSNDNIVLGSMKDQVYG
jgi:hypothetical protein